MTCAEMHGLFFIGFLQYSQTARNWWDFIALYSGIWGRKVKEWKGKEAEETSCLLNIVWSSVPMSDMWVTGQCGYPLPHPASCWHDDLRISRHVCIGILSTWNDLITDLKIYQKNPFFKLKEANVASASLNSSIDFKCVFHLYWKFRDSQLHLIFEDYCS